MQSIFSALVCYILTKKPLNRGENNEKNNSLGPQNRRPQPLLITTINNCN